MALTRRVWGAGKLLALVAALVATYALSFVLAMRFAARARNVIVPVLAGRTVNEASTLLSDEGLTLRVEEARRFDPKVPAGRVVAQDPPAGGSTRQQRVVKVWVSEGPASTRVPALVGESERTAQIRSQMAALTVSAVAAIHSSDYPAGTVVAQWPPADRRAGAVAVLVNRGEAGTTYVMPDLIGVDGSRAAEIMRARGLRVSVVGEQPYPGVPAGTVIRQRPQAGFRVAPGDPISLEVTR
jgi:serine/threonine-protein kinase